MKQIALSFALFLLGFTSQGQSNADQTVFFAHNIHQLSPETKATLDTLLESLYGPKTYQLDITGHTDDVGEEYPNLRLSERRASSVQSYLVAGGIPGDRIKLSYLGETSPKADNETEEGRQQNRRVEIITSYSLSFAPGLVNLFEKETQVFTVLAHEDIVIEGEEGSRIEIPAGSLVNSKGDRVSGELEIRLDEYYSISDQLAAGLHTMSNENLLETGGMIYIEASSLGEDLSLAEGSSALVRFASDSIPDDMATFLGDEEEGEVNWQPVGGVPRYIGWAWAEPLDDNDSSYMAYSNAFDSIAYDSIYASTIYTNSILTTSRLGWINCDRFLRETILTSLQVKFNDIGFCPALYLVLKDINSIMPGYTYSRDNSMKSFNIPIGYKVTLIGAGRYEGQCYYGSMDLEIEKDGEVQLELLELTENKLKKELRSLDR